MATTTSTAMRARHALLCTTRTSIVTLGLVLATVATAQAKDLCVILPSFEGGALEIVGKRFTVPRKGQCKPFNGFIAQGLGVVSGPPVSGAGCTSADGMTFQLHMTAQLVETLFSMQCGFGAAALEGGCSGILVAAPGEEEVEGFTGMSASAAPCTVDVP
jgi:hypothetical protein